MREAVYYTVPAALMLPRVLRLKRVLVTLTRHGQAHDKDVVRSKRARLRVKGLSHDARPRLDGARYLVAVRGKLPPEWTVDAVKLVGDDDAAAALAARAAWQRDEVL